MHRTFGGRSSSHAVLVSILLERQNEVIICIEEVVDVVCNAECTPVAPGFGVSLSVESEDAQGDILCDSTKCICKVVLELRWSSHHEP